jgi:predicted DNA-binding transcriptional regulator YafY
MREPRLAAGPLHEVDDAELDRVLKDGYGIFAGDAASTAVLRFTPERAQWVSKEKWHPDQTGEFLDDGSWRLTVPYSKPDELVMDILKHGPHVEVLGPAELRSRVGELLAEASVPYTKADRRGMKESA